MKSQRGSSESNVTLCDRIPGKTWRRIMVWVYVLICVIPILVLILTCVVIGSKAVKSYRRAKEAMGEINPYLKNLQQELDHVQNRLTDLEQKGQELTNSVEEIQGRWVFIREELEETTQSPLKKALEEIGELQEND